MNVPRWLVRHPDGPTYWEADALKIDDRHFVQGKLVELPQEYGSLSYFLGRYNIDHYAEELFDQHAITLPPHVRRSVHKRQAEFLAGRLCAREILNVHGHVGYTVATGMQREPLWPQGMIGSITHSGHYAAAIACPAGDLMGIGIDIESVVNPGTRDAVLGTVVSVDEFAYLRSREPGMDIDRLLTLCFSAKESFFKAAFASVKCYFGFEAIEIVDIDLDKHIVGLRCTRTLCAQLATGSAHEAYFEFLGDAAMFTSVILKAEPSTLLPSSTW